MSFFYRMRTFALGTFLLTIGLTQGLAQSDLPAADIVNDEGGAVSITGEVEYTNTLFTSGVAQPVIILEDQAGFIDRDRQFLMPVASQTLGQITSDFYDSPFTYSLALPIEPQGTYRDVDNDGGTDQGVQVYAVAYWTNTFGDAYLEERDLYGGGWSTAYASTLVTDDSDRLYEIIGGKFLVYAPDDEQGFPSGFGDDELLFTEDDPTVRLPQGYTVVDMDTQPFTFDRSAEPVIDLIEPEGAALEDFSSLSYTDAFDAMVQKFREEYAFTDYKNIDWDALSDEYRPRFEDAERDNDVDAYVLALRDFTWEIPDGHIAAYPGTTAIQREFENAVSGGIGIIIRDVDDGRVIVSRVIDGSSAEDAGIEVGAEITEINGNDIDAWVDTTVAYNAPFSSDEVRRLQQLRYAVRFPYGDDVEVTYRNPGDNNTQTDTLFAGDEVESYNRANITPNPTGFELPVEYRILNASYAYVRITSFTDNDLLTIQLWERMIQTLNGFGVSGLIIDMRSNGGGSGFLADQMTAYFFDEPLELGTTLFYDRLTGEFATDEERADRMFLPAPELRYDGDIAVLVGPSCASACEFFSYNMTLDNRAAIVGQYATAGLGGSITDFAMPEGQLVRFTVGRAVNADGEIHIEGIGVVPTVRVPVTEETLFFNGDVVLDYAIRYLDGEIEATEPENSGNSGSGNSDSGSSGSSGGGLATGSSDFTVTDGGTIEGDDAIKGVLALGERVQYTFTAEDDVTLSLALIADTDGDLDTVLRIYDADGTLIIEHDDIETGIVTDSVLEAVEVSGGDTIIIEVASYRDRSAGAYVLDVLSE